MGAVDRTLILCIDGDNDIGVKANVETPIRGREAMLQSATALAVSDPEEADANAMFGAVKLYDRLTKQYPDEEYEVACIAGHRNGGVEADRKMIQELMILLSASSTDGVILVTDGFADEELLPIVQSRIPITSIHHVVVKHSERIEETWAIIFRYMKMILEVPYYSRVTLGVPGVILVILGFLMASNQLENAGMMVAFVTGMALVLKGFGWDERLTRLRPRLPPLDQQLNYVSTGLGGVLLLIGCYQGVSNASYFIPAPAQPLWDLSFWAGAAPTLVAAFLLKGVDLFVVGIIVMLIGNIASCYIQKDDKLWQYVVGLIVAFWMRFIIIESAEVLMQPEKTLTLWSPLIFYTVASVTTTIAAVALIYRKYRKILFQE